jgi:hypothetical protein
MKTYYRALGQPNLAPNENPEARANVTRIDLYQQNDGTLVFKYAEGWTASTPAISRRTVPPEEKSFDDMLAWLQSNGWTVRTWPNGARAWKGAPKPVRTAGQIMRKRESLERYPRPDLQLCNLDLALDL